MCLDICCLFCWNKHYISFKKKKKKKKTSPVILWGVKWRPVRQLIHGIDLFFKERAELFQVLAVAATEFFSSDRKLRLRADASGPPDALGFEPKNTAFLLFAQDLNKKKEKKKNTTQLSLYVGLEVFDQIDGKKMSLWGSWPTGGSCLKTPTCRASRRRKTTVSDPRGANFTVASQRSQARLRRGQMLHGGSSSTFHPGLQSRFSHLGDWEKKLIFLLKQF